MYKFIYKNAELMVSTKCILNPFNLGYEYNQSSTILKTIISHGLIPELTTKRAKALRAKIINTVISDKTVDVLAVDGDLSPYRGEFVPKKEKSESLLGFRARVAAWANMFMLNKVLFPGWLTWTVRGATCDEWVNERPSRKDLDINSISLVGMTEKEWDAARGHPYTEEPWNYEA